MPGAVHMFIPNAGQKVSSKWSHKISELVSSTYYWCAESGKIPL